MKRTADTKNRAPETANTGSIVSASNFLGRLLNDLATFAERIDRLSFHTRFILLIIALSLIMPISFGIAVYLILAGLAVLLRGS